MAAIAPDPRPAPPLPRIAGGVRNLSKRFGPIRALTDVSISFEAGKVTALLGENGAGKSTLVRVLSGGHQPSEGVVELDGRPVHLPTPIAANRAGVAVVHQEPQLIAERTIAENIFLSRLGEKSWRALHSRAQTLRAAETLLADIGLADSLPDPARLCRDLTAAERQMVEIARALALKPRILFLDEPNSSLTRQETEKLFEVVRRFRDDGVAIVLVSHRLGEVYEISDHIVVLRDGAKVGEGSLSQLPLKKAIQLMAGERLAAASARAAQSTAPRRPVGALTPVLSLRKVTGARFHDVSLDFYPGEIVGMAGLVGSGRSETARGVIGIDPLLGGELHFMGRPARFRSAGQAVRAGISFISEERRTSVFHQQDVRFNLTCTIFDSFGRFGLFSRAKQTDYARREAKAGGVKADGVETRMGGLSGGNQQKVLIARALASNPKLIILDEPTRGVDVRTKADIYQLLRSLAHERGMAVWVISSEMDEILQVSDRIAVMHEGTLSQVLERGPEAANVVAAALGESLTEMATDEIAAGLTRDQG